jgi:hypothetical protein
MTNVIIAAICAVTLITVVALLVWSSRKSAAERIAMMKLRMAAKDRAEAEDLDEVQRDAVEAKEAVKRLAADAKAREEQLEVRLSAVENRANTIASLIRKTNPAVKV